MDAEDKARTLTPARRRYFWRERLAFWIARQLPARVAYFAFIRVHAASEAWWIFDAVARTWEDKHGL